MNTIELYKKSIINFTKNSKWNEIDFLVGIIFLSKMNNYCKENNISYHGYYMAEIFINLYYQLNEFIEKKTLIKTNFIIHFYDNLTKNIEYMNDRIENEQFKNQLKNNLYKFIKIINPYFEKIIQISNNKNISYVETIDNLLTPFFYILIQTSIYLGLGKIENNPNLLKLSEYYSNIFYTYIILVNKNEMNKQEIFDNYTDNKIKIHESYINLNFNSKTITEILLYLDNIILDFFSK